MKISEQAKKAVNRWSAAQHRPLFLELHTVGNHPLSTDLAGFCRWLAGSCGMVRIDEKDAGEEGTGLFLRQGAIIYRTVPMGTELEPFLEALANEGAPGNHRPAELQLYVAAGCPNCPTVVRSLLPLAPTGGSVTVEVIDIERCGDLEEVKAIKSVPALLLDGNFRWTGPVRPGDIETLLAPGDRWDFDAKVLERLLENGNAGPVATLMFDEGHASPALSRLMAAEAMSVRLGAMMVVEVLLERDAALVERLIPALLQTFPTAPEPARGDMLYIFGEAGSPSMVPEVEALLATDLHPEVAEAAREALERLAERHQ